MKKKLRFFLTMLILTLVGGVNVVCAQEVTYNFTGSDWTASNGVLTNGTVTINGEGSTNFKMNSGYFMLGQTNAYITLPAYDFDVQKIEVVGRSGASGSVIMNVFVGDVAICDATTGITGTNTYNIPSNYQTAGTRYTLKVTSKHNAQFTYIKIYKVSGGNVGPVNPTVTFANESEEIEVGETVTNALTKPDDLTVTFSSNPTSVATVDANGVVTGVAEGEATITASWAAVTDKYNAGSTSYTVTVNAATPAVNFVKVTNSNQLVAGNEYILVADESSVAMGKPINNNKIRDYVIVIIDNNKVAVKSNDISVLTLGGSAGAWTFQDGAYLAYSGDSNELHIGTDPTQDACKWIVTSDFQLQPSTNTNRYIRYNSGSPRFACYKSDQVIACLYVKENSPIDDKIDPELAFTPTTVTAEVGGAFTAPTLSSAEGFDGTIAYASSYPEVATVDPSTGEVTIVAAGETIISATSEPYGNFKDGYASYTLTVIDPNAPGTENNPYTVAQARAAIDAGTGMEGVYARGIVSRTDGLSSGTITYYISDDGTTTDQLEIYKGKSYNGENFTSADDIQVGDIVVVYGNLQKYNSIYEFNATNQLVSLERPVVPSHDVTFSANGTTFSTTTAKEGANIEFPTENPTDVGDFKFIGWSTADWNGVVDDSPTIITSATMGTDDMTIYAVYANAEVYGTRWKKVEENAVIEDGTYAILTCQTDSPDNFYAFIGTVSSAGHGMTTSETSEYVSFDIEGYTNSMPHGTCELTFVNNTNGFVISNAEDGYLYAKAARTGNLAWSMTQPDGYWSYANGDLKYSNGAYLRAYNLTIRTYAARDNQNILLAQKVDKVRYSNYCTNEIGNFEIVEFKTAGYKTYVTENAIDWDATDGKGVNGYKVSDLSTTSVTLQDLLVDDPITKANTPVILKGKKGKNLLVITSDEGVDISSTNLLRRGSDKKEEEKDYMYVLQKSDSWSEENPYLGYNFYPLNPDRWKEIGERQAYLYMGPTNTGDYPGIEKSSVALRFIHATDNEQMVSDDAGLVDGINDIQRNATLDGEFYSISGVRVSAPTKGLYIVKGKKVLVK